MKISEDNRHTSSATLFQFCKEALNIKHNYEVKVIDQHVGAILGFDPADCTHWKKGKRNVRSIHIINAIAEHLEVDPRVITDIVSGVASLEESLQEYRGYGAFELSQLEPQFLRDGDNLRREESRLLAQEILQKADIRSCPVMIPELFSALSNIRFLEEEKDDTVSHALVTAEKAENCYVIRVRKGDMRPHIRFLTAREIGRIFLYPELTSEHNDSVVAAQLNTFAMQILIPATLLQVATREATNTQDLVEQLSNFFWLGRSVINARIKDFFRHGN